MENIKHINLGVIGMSEGNGHPYSWSAIFNGYNQDYMKDCPFPVIFDYLSKQSFPADAIPNASVTHIWTQDLKISENIAKASNIPNIVANYTDLIGQVDAVLLARDDPKNHYEMAMPFIEAGIPIFIDKPMDINVATAKKMFAAQVFDNQIFSCSALRYAYELQLTTELIEQVGEIRLIDTMIPNSWEKYAVHIIEPVIGLIPERGKLLEVTNTGTGDMNIVTVKWSSGVTAIFKVLGSTKCPLNFNIYGTKDFTSLHFKDSFAAFKASLGTFINSIIDKNIPIKRADTLEIIEIIEKGFL